MPAPSPAVLWLLLALYGVGILWVLVLLYMTLMKFAGVIRIERPRWLFGSGASLDGGGAAERVGADCLRHRDPGRGVL